MATGEHLLSRETFVAHRVGQAVNTAEEADAIFDAIMAYSEVKAGSPVDANQFVNYFVLIAEIVTEEYFTEQSEIGRGRLGH